mgnify:CR=1 FL=1
MSLLNTQAILDEIPGFSRAKRGKGEVASILEDNGLSLEESIVELKNVMDNTTDMSLKAKILDLVLSMHGVRDKNPAIQVPTIVFQFQALPGSSNSIGFLIPPSTSSSLESLKEPCIRVLDSGSSVDPARDEGA